MINKEKSKRGGRRAGAGRPQNDSQLFTFRAGGDVAQCLNEQENKTDFIIDCIASKMTENELLNQVGRIYPVSQIEPMILPSFDVRVVAGFPIPLDNDERAQKINILRMLCPHPEASYLITVEGNSMIDSDIHSGDILIVDKSNRNPLENEVAMCELNGEYTIKYVRRHDGSMWLVPANENYPEIKVNESDSFNVWGVVTFVIHKPR